MLAADIEKAPQAEDVPRNRSIYQVVQETATGPRFLTSFDLLEDAMRNAAALNARSGNPFKTIMWGTDKPAIWVPPEKFKFQGDNILPSMIYHPGAVRGYPEALPISAVYKQGAEVVFLPNGAPMPTYLEGFSLGALPNGSAKGLFARNLSFKNALKGARELSQRHRSRIYVKAARGNRHIPVASVVPASRVDGLSDLQLGAIVTPVTPTEWESLRKAGH